jgi:hypothetical protein
MYVIVCMHVPFLYWPSPRGCQMPTFFLYHFPYGMCKHQRQKSPRISENIRKYPRISEIIREYPRVSENENFAQRNQDRMFANVLLIIWTYASKIFFQHYWIFSKTKLLIKNHLLNELHMCNQCKKTVDLFSDSGFV